MKVTTKGLEEMGKGQIKDSHLTGSGLANGTLLPLSINPVLPEVRHAVQIHF